MRVIDYLWHACLISFLIVAAPVSGWAQSSLLSDPEVIQSNLSTQTFSLGLTYKQPFGVDKAAFYTIDGGSTWLPAENKRSEIIISDTQWNQPQLLALPEQDWVHVWRGTSGLNGKIFDSTGGVNASEFPIGVNAANYPHARLAALGENQWVVTWSSSAVGYGSARFNQDAWGGGSVGGIFAQIFQSDGTAVGTPFQVNTYDADWVSFPVVTSTSEGFVVAWVSQGQDGSDRGIYAQRFDNTGSAIGSEFRVNAFTGGQQQAPSIASLEDGGFIVVWESDHSQDSYGVYAQRFAADGSQVGGETQISTATSAITALPQILVLENGEVLVLWRQSGGLPEGVDPGIYGRKYDADFISLGDPFQAHTETGLFSAAPTSADGFLVVSNELEKIPASGKLIEDNGGTGEIPVTHYSTDFHTPGMIAFSDGGFVLAIADTNNSPQLTLYPGTHQVVAEGIETTQTLQVQFKLVALETGAEWLSNARTFTATDGASGSISYLGGPTSLQEVPITLSIPEGGYHSIELFQKSAPYLAGVCGTYNDWSSAGVQAADTTEVLLTPENALCHQYKLVVTNLFGTIYEYTSENVVQMDRTPPILEIAYQVSGIRGQFQFTIQDVNSGVFSSSFQLNSEPLVVFSSDVLTIDLENGENAIVFEVIDEAGNSVAEALSVTGGVPPPEIVVYGVESGETYGGDFTLGYVTTQDLDNFLIFVDAEPISEVTILIDGEPSETITGVSEGQHTVVIQGKDAEDNVVTTVLQFNEGLVQVDTSNLAAGSHSLTLKGTDFTGELVTTTVDFTIDPGTFSLTLLSPQARTYEDNTLYVQYEGSEPIQSISYTINGGDPQNHIVLNELVDGDYEMVFTAETVSGKTKTITRSFRVTKAIPTLIVNSPEQDRVYPNNSIPIDYISDSSVTYQVGDVGTSVNPGDVVEMPEDGAYTMLFNAVHPTSGYLAQQGVDYETDSIVPEVTVSSPQPQVYNFQDIPIHYTTNKALPTIRLSLDGAEVSELTELSPGVHTFSFFGEDRSDRTAEQDVEFTVVDLKINSPQEGDLIISNTIPLEIPLQYTAEGPFNSREVLVDNGQAAALNGATGSVVLQTTAGEHDLMVRGTVGNTVVSKKVRVRVGAKNVAVGAGSIDYQIDNCVGVAVECDAIVRLAIQNSGDFDVPETFLVRFDHVTALGFTTEYFEIQGVPVGQSRFIDVPTFRATYGDRFIITLDPSSGIPGENPSDNSHEVTFEPGRLEAPFSLLRDDNVYLQDVSVFNFMAVVPVGGIQRVEFRVRDVVFVDEDPSNGFSSVVDMGPLTPHENCVQILGFNHLGTLMDTVSKCFNVRPLHMNDVQSHRFPWHELYDSGTNHVVTSRMDQSRYTSLREDWVDNILNLDRRVNILPVIHLFSLDINTSSHELFIRYLFAPWFEDDIGTHLQKEFQSLEFKGRLSYEVVAKTGNKPHSTQDFGAGPLPLANMTRLPTNNGKMLLSLDPRNRTCALRGFVADSGGNVYMGYYVDKLKLEETAMGGSRPLDQLGWVYERFSKEGKRDSVRTILRRALEGRLKSPQPYHEASYTDGYCHLSDASGQIHVRAEGRFHFNVEHNYTVYIPSSFIGSPDYSGYRPYFGLDGKARLQMNYLAKTDFHYGHFDVTGFAEIRNEIKRDVTYKPGSGPAEEGSKKKEKIRIQVHGEEFVKVNASGQTLEANSFYWHDVDYRFKTKDCNDAGFECVWPDRWNRASSRSPHYPNGGGVARWP